VSAESMAYVAHKSCGCVVMVHSDKPQYAKDVARELAACVRDGYIIERVPVETASALPWTESYGRCSHDSPAEAKQREARKQRNEATEKRKEEKYQRALENLRNPKPPTVIA